MWRADRNIRPCLSVLVLNAELVSLDLTFLRRKKEEMTGATRGECCTNFVKKPYVPLARQKTTGKNSITPPLVTRLN
jgi:hypothetical protein